VYQTPLVYNDSSHNFANGTFEPLSQLDQLGLIVTNHLQAYILDGNNVIDYVQFRDPVTIGGLNQALANAPDPNNTLHSLWNTNIYSKNASITYGVFNQLQVSGGALAPPTASGWSKAPTPMGNTVPDEIAFFNGFFVPSFQGPDGKNYVNRQPAIQAPYTPSRTVYSAYLLQANDPLVHYTSSDLGSQMGTLAVSAWSNQKVFNGVWAYSDDPLTSAMPIPPTSPVNGRYQPWGIPFGQLASMPNKVDNQNPYNVSYKDPLMWSADHWDFPTNQYPTVGWLGRVHRGTPWQTVYLKSTNILSWSQRLAPLSGVSTWASWTGNTLTSAYFPYSYYDGWNSAPQQDFLLFDIFTTRYNDNAVRGTLPVNVGMGRPDGGLAAWAALFSGMTALTNTAPAPISSTALSYTNWIVSPAGIGTNSALWKIVNGTNGINATRANTNLFLHQVFVDAGQILFTPALTLASPFLSAKNANQAENGINDEMVEWLPQQMMGLVRSTEQRYVLYCFGQTLRPAQQNARVLGAGPAFNQMVTNYQVTAESVVRAVIRVDNANTTQPHAVVESYNVLPPF